MSRYESHPGIEGQYEPGSRRRVLRNLRGILRPREMDQAEAGALLHAQESYLSLVHRETRFTAALLCRMHRDWLGGIYVWAGRYRTVEMSKAGFVWPPAILVAQNMKTFERSSLAALTPCHHSDIDALTAAMAQVQAEFLLVHPFREGNGRIARWLTDLMAMQSGFPALDYAFQGRGGMKHATCYLHAIVRGYRQDYEPLARFLADALRRALDRPRPATPRRTPRAPSK